MTDSQPVAARSRSALPRKHRHVDRAHQLGIRLEREVRPRQFEQLRSDLGHGDVATRADVVHLPGDAPFHQESVGPHHVAHVGEVASGRQGAHP